jgi:hypothetical protein
LTKSAALEGAAFGVRVNAVAPGPIETAILDRFTGSSDRKAGLVASVPLQRAGRPEEIADAIVFVASAKASFITGQVIAVNGGRTASNKSIPPEVLASVRRRRPEDGGAGDLPKRQPSFDNGARNLWTAALSSRSGLGGVELRMEVTPVAWLPRAGRTLQSSVDQRDVASLATRLASRPETTCQDIE